MRLRPFAMVDRVPFSARREDVERMLGRPLRTQTNGIGLIELDYGSVVYRFQVATGRLEEVTEPTPVLYLIAGNAVVDLPFAALETFVRSHDTEAFDRAAFLISPRYGFAFVPTEPDWMTALAAHCITTWRKLGATVRAHPRPTKRDGDPQ